MGRFIDGIEVGGKTKDLRDQTFGRLVVKALTGRDKHGKLVWSCQCSCGKMTKVRSQDLTIGRVLSCGCYNKDVVSEMKTTHGMTETVEYRAWLNLKYRCCCKNHKHFQTYSALGLSENFKEDFLSFLDDIGPVPDGFEGKPTVDRIDNTVGYYEGNVRWANHAQQSRNRGMSSNNPSGVTGVTREYEGTIKDAWRASWKEDGGTVAKTFSVNKYGEKQAFLLACKARESAIEYLNSLGYGYTEGHGK